MRPTRNSTSTSTSTARPSLCCSRPSLICPSRSLFCAGLCSTGCCCGTRWTDSCRSAGDRRARAPVPRGALGIAVRPEQRARGRADGPRVRCVRGSPLSRRGREHHHRRGRQALPARRLVGGRFPSPPPPVRRQDRKSTRLNSSHLVISYAVFCLKKKKKSQIMIPVHTDYLVTML